MNKKIVISIIALLVVIIGIQGVYLFKSNKQLKVAGSVALQNNANASGQQSTGQSVKGVHPIFISTGEIIGGTVDGEWKETEDIIPLINGAEKYKLYDETKLVREITDTKQNLDKNKDPKISNTTQYWLNRDVLHGNNTQIFEFGISGEWNALPRTPRELDTKDESFVESVKLALQEKGFDNPKVIIDSAIAADIDGDKMEEKIICATSLTKDQQDKVAEGRLSKVNGYSIILMQKTVDGVQKDITIKYSDFSHDSIELFSIDSIADYNGDGKLEILCRSDDIGVVSIEGVAFATFEMYEFYKNDFIKGFSYFKSSF